MLDLLGLFWSFVVRAALLCLGRLFQFSNMDWSGWVCLFGYGPIYPVWFTLCSALVQASPV